MFSFIAESFREENIFEYNLSIQVNLNGFSFSVHNTIDNKLLALKCTPVKISSTQLLARRFQDWLETEKLNQKNFNKVTVYIFSNQFTLVPGKFNNKKELSVINQLLFGDDTSDIVETSLHSSEAKFLFTLSGKLKKVISDNFESADLLHPMYKVLDNPLTFFPSDSLRLIYSGKDLYLLYISDSEIKTCNAFRINHPNDALFYIISTLKQFTTEIKSVAVYYAGDSDYASKLNKELIKYFEKIKTFIPENIKNFTNLDQDILNKQFCLI